MPDYCENCGGDCTYGQFCCPACETDYMESIRIDELNPPEPEEFGESFADECYDDVDDYEGGGYYEGYPPDDYPEYDNDCDLWHEC